MSAEQTEAPPQDVEERLATMFGAKDDDAPEDEEDEEIAASDGDEVTDEPADNSEKEPEDDSEEVEFEGKSYRVPKELKSALIGREDYTKGKMDLAAQRRQVQDREHFLEARQQVMATASQELAELHAAQAELKKFASVDWVAVANADPGQAFALTQRQRVLEQTVAEKQNRLQQVAQHAEKMGREHNQKQWQMAVQGVRDALGKVTPEDDSRAMKLVQDLGFTESDMSKLADSRILQMAIKAARWEALQEAKPGVSKKAETAKPMKAIARSTPQAQREGATVQARQALKKTGSSAAAESYFENLFRRK